MDISIHLNPGELDMTNLDMFESRMRFDLTRGESSCWSSRPATTAQERDQSSRLACCWKKQPPIEACHPLIEGPGSFPPIEGRASSSCPTPIEWAQRTKTLPKLGLLSRLSRYLRQRLNTQAPRPLSQHSTFHQ